MDAWRRALFIINENGSVEWRVTRSFWTLASRLEDREKSAKTRTDNENSGVIFQNLYPTFLCSPTRGVLHSTYCWQGDDECRALIRDTLGRNWTMMTGDDLLGGGHTDSGALKLGLCSQPLERLEYLIDIRLIEPDAIVFNADSKHRHVILIHVRWIRNGFAG